MAIETGGADGTASRGTSVTVTTDPADPFDASSITWTEIIASTSAAWGGFYATIYINTTSFINPMIGVVATGAAGSETVIASFPVGESSRQNGTTEFFPIPVAAGARVSLGIAVDSGTLILGMIHGVPASDFDSASSITVVESGPYNLDDYTAANFLTALDPGTSANTKGSWIELSFTGGTNNGNNVMNGDSTGQVWDYLCLSVNQVPIAAGGTQKWLIDFGYGSAGSETVHVADIPISMTNAETIVGGRRFWFPWGRAAGDRLAVRAQCTGTGAARFLYVSLMGAR